MGSGKTTTLVARIAWLANQGIDPESVGAVIFNRRAAEELWARLQEALAPLGLDARAVRLRTFHALGREILVEAGRPVEPLVDRAEVLWDLESRASRAWLQRMDTVAARLKLRAAGQRAHARGPHALVDLAREPLAVRRRSRRRPGCSVAWSSPGLRLIPD